MSLAAPVSACPHFNLDVDLVADPLHSSLEGVTG
jgi:hypothetical protein